MKVFELAKKINKTSKEILKAASYLEINVKSNTSILNNEEVKKIIRYFRKKRILFLFRRYASFFVVVFCLLKIRLILLLLKLKRIKIIQSGTIMSNCLYGRII